MDESYVFVMVKLSYRQPPFCHGSDAGMPTSRFMEVSLLRISNVVPDIDLAKQPIRILRAHYGALAILTMSAVRLNFTGNVNESSLRLAHV